MVTQTRNLGGSLPIASPGAAGVRSNANALQRSIELFRALGDPSRVALVAWLARQRVPRTVSEIVDSGCCPVDFSVVSRHLRTLREAEVVVAERTGREVRYRLAAASLAQTPRHIA